MSLEIERAWAAGFFDGEGSTFVVRSKTPTRVGLSLGIGITQHKDPYVLHRFTEAVGFGKVHGPYIRSFSSNPDLLAQRWRYTVYGLKAHYVLKALWPYLSPIKRVQANEAIKLCRAAGYKPHKVPRMI